MESEQYQQSQVLSTLKKSLESENRLILKDISINKATGDEKYAKDDFYLLYNQGYQNYKVSQINIYKNNSNQLTAIRFTYKQYQNLQGKQSQEIEGNILGEQDTQNKIKEQIKLNESQFITKIVAVTEFVIDNLFITLSDGIEYQFGNHFSEKQETQEYLAPKGFHYTCFSGLSSSHFQRLCLLKAEVCSIEEYNTDQKSKFIGIIAENKSTLRSLIPYLTIQDLSRLMRSNKLFTKILLNESLFIDEIGRRAFFSGFPNLIKYYQTLKKIKQENLDSEQQINTYKDNIKNYVSNPNGEQYFEGFEFYDEYQQPAQKLDSFVENLKGLTHFKFSYRRETIVWQKKLKDIFSPKDIENIENSNLAIVFGIEIADSNYGGTLSAEVEIKDENSKNIFYKKKDFEEIQRGFKFYNIAGFIKSQNANQSQPHQIKFSISGNDTRFWRGHFGPRLRSISCRLIPVQTEQEINLFTNSFKNQQ